MDFGALLTAVSRWSKTRLDPLLGASGNAGKARDGGDGAATAATRNPCLLYSAVFVGGSLATFMLALAIMSPESSLFRDSGRWQYARGSQVYAERYTLSVRLPIRHSAVVVGFGVYPARDHVHLLYRAEAKSSVLMQRCVRALQLVSRLLCVCLFFFLHFTVKEMVLSQVRNVCAFLTLQ